MHFCKACQYEDQPSVWLLYQQQGRGAGSVYPCIGNRGAARADSRIFMLRYTKFGRSLYAVGGSEQSATMMGLDVKKTKLKAYVLSSFLCSIGGICYCLNTMSGNVQQALRT